jgi:hypothetical protein
VAGATFHTSDNATRSSTLRLENISGSHGGKYSCVPARIHAQSVVLHVPDAAEKRLPYNGGPDTKIGGSLTNFLGAFYVVKMVAASVIH